MHDKLAESGVTSLDHIINQYKVLDMKSGENINIITKPLGVHNSFVTNLHVDTINGLQKPMKYV